MKIIKRTITGKKKNIGSINGEKYIKHIQFSKHFFRKTGALGIDADLIPQLTYRNVKVILLIDDETGNKYICSVLRFLKHSWIHNFERFQPQQFLTIDRWHVYDKNNQKIQEAFKEKVDHELDLKKEEFYDGELIPRAVKLKLLALKNSTINSSATQLNLI